MHYEELEREKRKSRSEQGAGHWLVERRTARGVIKEELTKCSLRDGITSEPADSLVVLVSALNASIE